MMPLARRALTLALAATLLIATPGAAQDDDAEALDRASQLNQQGLAKWFNGDYPGALQELAQAIELAPDWNVPYNTRALVWVAFGNPLAGLADANRAVDLARGTGVPPENLVANLDTRAYLYLKLGWYDDALDDYEVALGSFIDPQAESLLGRGLTLAALGDNQRAFVDFNAGLRFAMMSRPNPQLMDLVMEARTTLAELDVFVAADEYEPDDSPANATPLTLDGWLQGHSLHAGDVDWVSFSLVAGQRLHLFTNSPTCDTVLSLFGPDRTTLLAENDNGGTFRDSVIDYSVATTGTHYARVRHADPKGTCVTYDLGGIVSPQLGPPPLNPTGPIVPLPSPF